MIALERWYRSLLELKEDHGKRPTLVVIIQDFESFDQETLQDFIMICHSYQERIPFVFLMGLATSIDALHQGLPKSVLSLLQTKKFQMQQSSECLTAIVEDLFVHANVGLMVGPLPLKQLIDQFMHYNFSVGGFVANLKYIVMHHFYANPLSILCDRSLNVESRALELLSKGHFDHIRMLPSFQRYIETTLESDPQLAEMLLLDNEFLMLQIPELIQELQDYHQDFAMIFDFLWFIQSKFSVSVLRKSKRALYFMALEGTLTSSSNVPFLLALDRKLNSNDMMVFIEDCVRFFKENPRCAKKLPHEENAMDKELANLQNIRDRFLKANDDESRQTRIAQKSRDTIRLPKGVLGTYTLLVSEIDEFLAKLFSTYLDCHTKMPLYEICYYSQVTIQQKAFLPQPRASIQTALGQPELYLNCECCHPPSADMVLPTQHDTCILYKLYVECGRMINMYDWFTAFGKQKPKATTTTKTKKQQKQQPEQPPQRLDQKEVQARFISGVAELQFMGFIKPTNRKTDHVQRLTWGNI
ncbi:MAG: origin recognition complex subunit 3 N-terminus-domain-containing protein [Benniella sp.]|nr:MAG: origin recognition complex subunit 3 N-terminus-domain-containing protein [Benniella sp.]